MRSCWQVPKAETKNTDPETRREEEWAGWHGPRQTLRLRRCHLFPRQGRWMLEDWTNSQAPASWRSSVSESFLGKSPPSLWNWKAKGSSEESRSSFRRHTRRMAHSWAMRKDPASVYRSKNNRYSSTQNSVDKETTPCWYFVLFCFLKKASPGLRQTSIRWSTIRYP